MHASVTVDLDPGIVGWMAQVAETIVCVKARTVENDPKERRLMIDLVKRQGGDCATCRGCFIGRDM